jgi:hypothetical protein
MPRIHPGDEQGFIPREDVLAWMEAAELLSREVNRELDYAQAHSAFAQAVNDDELGEAGEWEGDPTNPETIDIIASWLQEGHLDELLHASFADKGPGEDQK